MNLKLSSVGRVIVKINLTTSNNALVSIIEDPDQVITIDANFMIPPSRSQITSRSIGFEQFNGIWLDPIFTAFSNLAIHESVYEELVGTALQTYVNKKRDSIPPGIIIHTDSSLNEIERILRDTIEVKISVHTNYDPLLDNKDDRGEVKSLSYIAVKGLLYFAAHDNNAIQLIEKSKEWSTGLDNVQAIKMYEIIYYLYKKNLADKKVLKMLYKYQYYLTANEQKSNPEWGVLIASMDEIYGSFFE